ncbi:hypothetical protein F5X68DRAFT_223748 [Plectosphaerella plurivora]|uniref:Ketoreductase domain-containing protein n=1 Tax=Plectosphaerella plurivora TaxID=936078 RepID=A0A9P9A960_9PEZI|nr:hypothetical protein F5X68DRAFT_223748 [Plectosphaerella plurivora]
MKFENKLFVVTGGLSGLGAGTTKHLQALGGHVAVIDLTLPKKATKSTTLRCFKADVSNLEEVALAVQGILQWAYEKSLDIHGVVCCAGFLGPAKILSKSNTPLALERFRKVVDISLVGTIDIIRQLLPRMASQKPDADGQRGVLITVASAAAFDGQEGQVAYSAAKGAIASMTLPLARDLASQGIRAVCISPGLFDSNMTANMPAKAQESVRKGLEFPARGGRPDEFAAMVEHIVDNHMLNGTVIRLDGASRLPARL